MKKVYLIFFASFALFSLFSTTIYAQGLVPCGTGSPSNPRWARCELNDIFSLILNIFIFLVKDIATPLAGLMIVIGGVLMIVSGGPGSANPITGIASPNLYNKAKGIIIMSVVAWFLIFASWLIIDTVLKAIGYVPPG